MSDVQVEDKATPLKLPVRLDLDAYTDAVIHDANWRRIASFPKTELGTAMAQQVTDALNQSAAHDALVAAATFARNRLLQNSGDQESIDKLNAALKAADQPEELTT